MKINGVLLLLATIFTVLAPVAKAQNCPNGVRTRRSWHDLTRQQRFDYTMCVRRIYASGHLWRMSRKHSQMTQTAHFNPYFLPFHRCFLREWQLLLDAFGCSHIGVPYWDVSFESRNWENSPIWIYKGSRNGPITGGGYSGLRNHTRARATRNVTGNTTYSSAQVASIINRENTFTSYSERSEVTQHAQVHIQIGGGMNSLAVAASDPIFYQHHAAIDRNYAQWQGRSPAFYSAYSGNANQVAPGFEWYGWTIRQCIEYRENDCFRYQAPQSTPRPVNLAKRALLEENLENDLEKAGSKACDKVDPEHPAAEDVSAFEDAEYELEPLEASDEYTKRYNDAHDGKPMEEVMQEIENDFSPELDVKDADIDLGLTDEVKATVIEAVPEAPEEVESLLEQHEPTAPYADVAVNPEDMNGDPFSYPDRVPDEWCQQAGKDCGFVHGIQAEEEDAIDSLNKLKEEEGQLESVEKACVAVEVGELQEPETIKEELMDVWTAVQEQVSVNVDALLQS